MKIGIGVDTGGTYTDAVAYDFDSASVLACAKALTTRDDLSLGISRALDALPENYLKEASMASLSTTLATNACVEGKGRRAKLLFIGVGKDTLDRVGSGYGDMSAEELFFCDDMGTFDGTVVASPDWEALLSDAGEWLRDADSLGVVEMFAVKNGGACEKAAKEFFSSRRGIPVVCGSELFSGLDSVQRGSGTLLNAKLVPIIDEFLAAIEKSFRVRGVHAPVVVVRSDGSLMSESFSRLRPVETILCGPAASVLGGMKLASRPNAVIVDMGGTTTDISLVRAGVPVKVTEGISIGAWRTFVKGVFIDTFGLGGDSAVRVRNGRLSVETGRVLPISLLAKNEPSVLEKLRDLLKTKSPHTQPIHEFFCLLKDITSASNYSEEEKRFCAALKNGPLDIREAAAQSGTDIYHLKTSRLETEGVIIRSGLTPTDIMHIRGDFSGYDTEAARLTAMFVMRCLELDETSEDELTRFCESVYDAVKKKLYCNIVRVLLQDTYPELRREPPDAQLSRLIERGWEAAGRDEKPYFSFNFLTSAALVGIGAPIHIFLPDVAKALGTECVIPENAGVANAVGAIVGNISVTTEVEIHPNHTPGGIRGYTVHTPEGNFVSEQRSDAEKIALEAASSEAVKEARRRGLSGEISVTAALKAARGTTGSIDYIDLGSIAEATAIGAFSL